jgi:uncharacterized RDD family membrane protein YckC
MDNEPAPPEKYVIPPPTLPQAPPPGKKAPAAPAVNVKIREPGKPGEERPETGGPAPFNTRILAVMIDVVLALGLQISAAWILPSFAGKIAWLVGIGYFVTRDSLPFLGGQSVGKKAMKLRAVTLEGKPLTGNWEPVLIRNGVLLIPFFPLIELFVLLTREDKAERGRRLGDEWAKTKVILEPEKPAADEGNPA